MTAEKYVHQIIKNIQCDKKRRTDIAKQLMAEIEERISLGESLDKIISEMGTVKEVADSFNENISPESRKKYKRNKSIIIAVLIILILILLGFAGYWMLPKVSDIQSSRYFSEQEIEEKLISIIDLLDNGEYSALQEMSTPQMASFITANNMEDVKSLINSDFGEQIAAGTIYSQEITSRGQSFAVCQVNVVYGNVAVTYTITFDQNMKLAGLYMK